MKRYPMNKRSSRKSFNSRVAKTKGMNLMTPLRGGIRL